MLNAIRLFLAEIRIEHTLFALPFAYVGAIVAAHGLPSLDKLLWITLAVLGARTAAMAANRYLDRKIDARNPRTAKRGLANGSIAPATMLWGGGIGLLVLVVSAFLLNPLCAMLLPVAALGIFVYPLCKRFTWSTHFVLGAVDGFAPLGAFIAITNTIAPAGLLLFAAVTCWVAGFDIIYALMDRDIDVEQNIRSIPARFGAGIAHWLPLSLHVLTGMLLLAIVPLAHPAPIYLLGVALVVPLAWREQRLLARMKDVFALNDEVFKANMLFSTLFLLATLASFIAR